MGNQETRMSTLAFKIVGNLHIVVCGAQRPSTPDWIAYINEFKSGTHNCSKIEDMATFVISDGGGPDSAQRKVVADELAGRPSPVAIVSHHTFMRGVVTALSWFNPSVRAFSPTDTASALRYLGVPDLKHEVILRTAREVREKSGLPIVKSLDMAAL